MIPYFRVGEPVRKNVNNEEVALSGFAVAAVFIAALDAPPRLLADFLDEERSLAGRAGFIHRTIPERIFAFRIPATRVKGTALAGAFLDEIAATIGLWTLHT